MDTIFIGALTYCLSAIVDQMPINCDIGAPSTWHTYPELSGQIQQGRELLQSAAESVWSVLVQSKLSVLKDLVKPPRGVLESDLSEVKDFLRESTYKTWMNFLESCEKKISVPPVTGATGAVTFGSLSLRI